VELYEVMRTARTIRRFRDDAVPPDVLRRCLEAATWAPSGGNLQPWRFIVLQSPETRAVMKLGADKALKVIEDVYGYARPGPDENDQGARDRRAVYELHDRAAEVPVGVLFAYKELRATPPEIQGSAIFAAMENFLLACRNEGLGAVVTGWGNTADAELRVVCGIPPEWKIATIVAAGYPQGGHGVVRRKAVDKVAFVDRWDAPLR
jgi:nitroreductase